MAYVTLKDELVREYIAIKVKGLNYYLWFKTKEITFENGRFSGTGGWGDSGTYTNIECDTCEIISIIYSDSPQYR